MSEKPERLLPLGLSKEELEAHQKLYAARLNEARQRGDSSRVAHWRALLDAVNERLGGDRVGASIWESLTGESVLPSREQRNPLSKPARPAGPALAVEARVPASLGRGKLPAPALGKLRRQLESTSCDQFQRDDRPRDPRSKK